MKKISLLFLLACLTIGFAISCERDDICPDSTSTTPRLIIEFFDISNQENVKSVSKLRVQGVDNDAVLEGYDAKTTKDLILPLRTDANSTQYILHEDYTVDDNKTPNDPSDDVIKGNEDTITINYNREDVYVSRACGYKTIFKNVTITIENDSDNWILSRQSVNDNQSVEDESETHFKIFY